MNGFDLEVYKNFCEWGDAQFLIISPNVFDPLIYYSHLVPILVSLPLAALIFYSSPNRALNRWFLGLTVLFSLWSFFDLILWAEARPAIIMFFWSLLILIEPLIYFSAYFFAHYAFFDKRPPELLTYALALGILPVIILLPTTYSIIEFNLANCNREVTEGVLVSYGYLYQLVVLGVIALMGFTAIAKSHTKTRTILFVLGIILFLLTFSSGNIIGSLSEDWTLGQYGIFGMPIMIGFLSILITRYHVFNSKIIGAEILIGILSILTLGILFIQNISSVHTVAGISFILTVILGTILIKSIRKEIKQREHIEDLAKQLQKANDQLKILDKMKSEFVSIASHQLRSPLTAIRGYASMLLEGSYDKLPEKAVEAVNRISESGRYMALSIEDYLNVSRIESGNMKYEFTEFNLPEQAEKVVGEVRPAADKKGLQVEYQSLCKGNCKIKADIGKTRQVLHNLIDNAMKYTLEGKVTITVHDDSAKGTVGVSIKDTGVGMSIETQHDIFDKFVRAKNANNINVTGTGLGLFVAKKMIESMGGKIWAESEGENKGSTFHFEFPMVK